MFYFSDYAKPKVFRPTKGWVKRYLIQRWTEKRNI